MSDNCHKPIIRFRAEQYKTILFKQVFSNVMFSQDKKKKPSTSRPKKIRQKVIDEEDEDEDDEDWIKVDHGALDKPKMFEKDAEINHPLVVKKLIEIMAARGELII